MARLGFGTDGVRGEANSELTPEIALALGRAAAEVLGVSRVAIGLDTRRSGPMLESALIAGYTSVGVDCLTLGVVPTPAVAWVAASQGIGGAMISASHNPFADNGIKLFATGGLKLVDTVEAQIESRMHALLDGAAPAVSVGESIGSAVADDLSVGWADAVVRSLEGRRFDGLSVVLDCANGAASRYGPEVFAALGADLTVIGDQPDGININAACGSTHPESLQETVRATGADLGLAFDGDADRLIAVDGLGEIVDGDHVLAILATDWKTTGRLTADTLVVTVMSNLGLRLAMDRAGIHVIETGVGDRYVLEALNSGGYALGGEQSGHVICRDLSTTGDGVLAGVQLLDAVIRSGDTLADVAADSMTSLPQVLENVRLPQRDATLVDRLGAAIAEAEAELGGDGRVLVRPSGTEPLIRIMVEHVDALTAERVVAELVSVTEGLVNQQ
ncbi:MAG: phosphoglucosamine mutase [Acidimicrobiales bacterium]